jgi:hypothetical protein
MILHDSENKRRLFFLNRKKWLDEVQNDLNKMDVRGWRKLAKDKRRLEIYPEGGRGSTWSVEPVVRERKRDFPKQH